MYCITRHEMKFGDIIVPARTKATVINIMSTTTVDAPGVHILMSVSNYEIKRDDIENEKKVIDKWHNDYSNATLFGFVINTNALAVYMDAGDKFYWESGLYDWQLEKIFGDKIPENLFKGKYQYNGKDARLQDVISYLEEEFAEWVGDNCKLIKLSKRDIENGMGLSGSQPGDYVLSEAGIEQFMEKKLEYQKRLEITGFTYDFAGGLTWE